MLTVGSGCSLKLPDLRRRYPSPFSVPLGLTGSYGEPEPLMTVPRLFTDVAGNSLFLSNEQPNLDLRLAAVCECVWRSGLQDRPHLFLLGPRNTITPPMIDPLTPLPHLLSRPIKPVLSPPATPLSPDLLLSLVNSHNFSSH